MRRLDKLSDHPRFGRAQDVGNFLSTVGAHHDIAAARIHGPAGRREFAQEAYSWRQT